MTGRPTSTLGATLLIAKTGANAADVLYQDKNRNVMAPSWSPGGDKIIFGIGVHNLFFNFFNGLVLEPADRTEGGAQIAMINPDGTGFHEVTSGASNSGFPSMAPDGKRFVYRSFGPDGQGLRIMNLETKAVTTLTEGYDNFPLWSPRGDLIMFSRQAQGAYEIYTIKPDGTGVKRLTFAKGNEAHQGWSPDGESIVFATSRMGFKDEASYTDGPQPYGELFVMRYDGTNIQQLTDNQWEDGTPAWQPRISAQGDALAGTAAYLVSYVEVTPSSRSTAVAALTAYREASRKDDGYIRVELFEQIGRSGHFAIVETWRDQKAIDAHGAATQKHLLDALQPIRVSGYDERAYKALTVGPAPPAANSRQISVVSHVDVTPDPKPAVLLRQLAERSRQEAGNVRFDVVQHTMRANHFTVVETWQSQQAFDAHVAAAHTRQFRDELQPFTGSPLDERVYTAIQ
jgi:quinol monooxygenase YgiN